MDRAITRNLQSPAARKLLFTAGAIGALVFMFLPDFVAAAEGYRLQLVAVALVWLVSFGFLIILSVTNSRISTLTRDTEQQHQSLKTDTEQKLASQESALSTRLDATEQRQSAQTEALETLEQQLADSVSEVNQAITARAERISAELQEMMAVGRVADVEHIAITAALLAGTGTVNTASDRLPETLHGHALLMRRLFADAANNTLGTPQNGISVLEIGTTREKWWPQMSTSRLAATCRALDLKMLTVDVDPKGVESVAELRTMYPGVVQAETEFGEKFAADWEGALPPYIYIDAYDFDHPGHSEERQDRYRDLQGSNINDEACWEMHLACARAFAEKCPPGGIVVFDDAFFDGAEWSGKGKTAVPYMLENGFELETLSATAAILSRPALSQ